MRTTYNVNFYCRRSKANKLGLAPVEMSILINGKREFLNLPRKEKPADYDKMVSSKKSNDLKTYLELMRVQVNQAVTEILESGCSLTTSKLKEYVQNGGYRKYTVEDLFDEYLSILKSRVGVNLQQCVYDKYVLVRDRFYNEISKEESVNSISTGTIMRFQATLNAEMAPGTVAGYMTKLKTIIMFGFDNGNLKTNPFNGVKISKPEEKVIFLDELDLKKISDKEFTCERLERVRDIFLFQCYSGLAYADMAGLCKEDIQVSGDTYYICKERIKTGIEYTAVVLSEGVKILEKYEYHLPVLSNQKYNSYLKEIADLCGIVKPMHTHIGRHTYATLCLNKGVRLEILSKMLGHSNVKQTQHYAKIVKTTIFNEVTRAFND